MEITHFIIVICLGLVLPSQAQDCSRPAPGANMVLKDSDILLNTFPSGSKATFVCDVGHTPGGGSGVVTCNAGSWSPVTLKCQRKTCGSPGQVENGDINYPTGNEFGDKLVVKCNPGFMLVGRSEIICGDQGWLGRLPVCEVVTCDPPSQIPGGTFSPVKETYDYRDVVKYGCTRDLTLSGSKTLTCSEDGTFNPAPPKCVEVECAEPEIANAEWVSGSRPPHKHLATVTYRCITGYKMEGAANLICNINSQWTPGIPKCTAVTCSPPPLIVNGAFSPQKESYQYSEVVEYSCQQGFTLSGSKSASCSPDGTFKGAPPTCHAVTCSPPPLIVNGAFSPQKESYQYSEVVEYSCQQGFTLSGSKSASCSPDGTFKGAPPTCHAVTCSPPPLIVNGAFSPQKESYQYSEVVEYSCQQGFTLSGSKSASCSPDGTFKGAPPTCHAVTCSPPPLVVNGAFSPQKESYQYSEVVEYSCQQGFTLSGSKSASCSPDGTFKDAPPTCHDGVTSTPTSTILGGVFGSLAVLLIAGIGVLVYKKKLGRKDGKRGTKPEEEVAF